MPDRLVTEDTASVEQAVTSIRPQGPCPVFPSRSVPLQASRKYASRKARVNYLLFDLTGNV